MLLTFYSSYVSYIFIFVLFFSYNVRIHLLCSLPALENSLQSLFQGRSTGDKDSWLSLVLKHLYSSYF